MGCTEGGGRGRSGVGAWLPRPRQTNGDPANATRSITTNREALP